MSKRIKACFDAPTPSEDLRQRVQTIAAQSPKQQKQKGVPAPMPLKIYSGLIATIIIGGLYINYLHPLHERVSLQAPEKTIEKSIEKTMLTQNTPMSYPKDMPIGDRVFRLYSVHENDKGEVMFVYTMGKTPDDALCPYKDGTMRVLDSSKRTQDWMIQAKNDALEHHKVAVHIPFAGNYGVDTKIRPERVAPDGCKYEAIAFRLNQKTNAKPTKKCYLAVHCAPKNLHGSNLRNLSTDPKITVVWYHQTLNFALSFEHQEYAPSERVPAAWAKYGVDVAEATRQLEELQQLEERR
jgi:hypothetical protein